MAKLTSSARNKIASDKFGDPKNRKYPMEDKSHAANAKSRVSEEEHKGKVSKSYENKIDSKANRILGKKK